MNWANRITIFRILLVPIFITAIMYRQLMFAFSIFLIASITDALDGYIARRFNQKTKLGSIVDPLADKLLIDSAFVCLSIVTGLPEHLKMPAYVPIVIVSRDVFILMGAAIIYLVNGQLDVKPTIFGKTTTVLQMATVVAVLISFPYSIYLWNLAVVFTVLSGLDYLRIGSKQINGKTE